MKKSSDLRKYISDRKKRDKTFARNYEEGYERIKAAAIHRETDFFRRLHAQMISVSHTIRVLLIVGIWKIR